MLARHPLRFADHSDPLTLLEDFHLHHLAASLRQIFVGACLRSFVGLRGRAARLSFEGRREPLVFTLHEAYPACGVGMPPALRQAERCDWCPRLSEMLPGARLKDVRKLTDDRILTLEFVKDETILSIFLVLRPIAPALYFFRGAGEILHQEGGDLRSQGDDGAGLPSRPRSHRLEPVAQQILPLLQATPPTQLIQVISRRVRNLGPTLVREALARVASDEADALAHCLAEISAAAYGPNTTFYFYRRHGFSPGEYSDHPVKDCCLAPFTLQSCAGWPAETFPSIIEAVSEWLGYALGFEQFTLQKKALQNRFQPLINTTARKIRALERQLAKAGDEEKFRRWGELVLVHLSKLGPSLRSESVQVEDIHHPGAQPVTIPLRPDRCLKDNVDIFFRLSRKARKASEVLPPRLEREQRHLAQLGRLAEHLQRCMTETELKELKDHLPEKSAAALPAKAQLKKRGKASEFKQYQTAAGRLVLVGRNAAGNDRLTFRVARPDDFWFHAADYPGSHVVLLWGKRTDPPTQDLTVAAAVAAWHSGARKAPQAEVHCCRCKQVRKVKGVPGRVTLVKYRTLRVRPGLPSTENT